MGIIPARHRQTPPRIRMLQFILLILVSAISYGALVYPFILASSTTSLQVGDVSPDNYQAPRSIRYESQVRTEEARLAAENAVALVYASPDPTISRRQNERLGAALKNITLVREDVTATLDQKEAQIASMGDIVLQPDTIEKILLLSAPRWDLIQQESLDVLEQVSRRSIREQDVDTVVRSLPSLVSFSLNEDQATLVVEIVSGFVVPNSLYNAELTESARQSAREAVEPVFEEYKAGEIIVLRGQIISPAQLEALQQLVLIQAENPWEQYAGAGALVLIVAAYIRLYFSRRRMQFLFDARSLIVIALIFIVFIVSVRGTIVDRTVVPYAFPLPALGLLFATLFGVEVGIVFSIAMALLAPYAMPTMLDLFPYYLISSLTGVLVLGAARRVWTFFRAGMAIAIAGIIILVAYRLPFTPTDGVGMAELAGAAVFSGLASSSIALLLQYFLAQAIGLTTALQLIEISRPDSPLLQYFLRNAPGTYQHSLQVANLAEQSAELIGADALLTRVGAMFHDVGKAMNPVFFIENQPQGEINTHDDIDPTVAAATIIAHVTDGVKLAHKHRLPKRIDDFILEHHGTMITVYQYNQAVQAAGGDTSKVDVEKFRYPGPRPRSRETALLLLADGAEARSRAERPQTEDDLRKIVHSTIENAQKQGQLDNTQLTLRDLGIITDSFVTILRGTHHPRISYPKDESAVQNANTIPRK
ncbi:MAG TPA: HDIG domain-containing protein [Anaerolineales bacterium]|nr:HDIG domain-containing protein [Anaerolineales bacterium]